MNLSNNMLRVAYELMYGKVPLKRFYWIRTIATLERQCSRAHQNWPNHEELKIETFDSF